LILFYFLAFLETATGTIVFVLHLFIFQRTTQGTITTKTIRPTTTKKQQQQQQ
jgi:hypothetical protein